jgi:hypothetical protein
VNTILNLLSLAIDLLAFAGVIRLNNSLTFITYPFSAFTTQDSRCGTRHWSARRAPRPCHGHMVFMVLLLDDRSLGLTIIPINDAR